MGLTLVEAPRRTTVSARAIVVVVVDDSAVVVVVVGTFCTGRIALRGKNTIEK